VTLAERLTIALASGMGRNMPLFDRDERISDLEMTTVDAAVLVAITDRPMPGVILTQRPMTMRTHPGQVAFPGGRVDKGDTDVVAAALREAQEEVGLRPSVATIVGLADPYRTVTGFVVTPVIAVIPADEPLQANAEEVDAIFEPPLAFLLDSANHKTNVLDWGGEQRAYNEIHWADRRIWGATAAMIVNLSRRLQWLD
jgi:8-oxo-dGTP pyrophosphatase MutT (NUDIX family)